MRKHQQRNILELLKTIKEAQSAALYADCQEGALSVGEFIEDIEGEGTQTVTLLEEYCELLYRASNGEASEKQLNRHLVKVENSVRSELEPNRIEVAFLSYKASMSDSLESIYLAAKEDPGCDAFWIPIPYYDRKHDGSVGEMHYEGAECYSDKFECADWQTYDVEARRPEVIFTFNPYDADNYVTSVHPAFYCERLRDLTDLLVYVPYFVVMDDVPEHFCTVAGCVYAHKVIVQSEKIRETYIRVFKETYGNRFGDPEEKFVALGSPKFDKVINSKCEDFTMPDEWLDLIGGRKVVLYNTSVGAILQGDEQYLKKLRYVLVTFRSRNDVTLWWRPHPLGEATYASMRPRLLDEYEQIVAEYIGEGWGIYDDTPDLHRALAWTDAYYGDWSSLVPMYAVTGKPVVIQDAENTQNSISVKFADFAMDSEGRFWGFDLFRDGLFELDFEKNTARYVAKSGAIPKYLGKSYLFSSHRYISIYCVNDRIFCFPQFTDSVLVFNSMSNTTETIPLDRSYLLTPESDGFALRFTVAYHGKIYCFSAFTKAVVVFDTGDCSVRYDTRLHEQIGPFIETGQNVKWPIYIGDCSDDGVITLIMRNCEQLISYTLSTQEAEIIASNPVLAQCILADFDGVNYWMVSENKDDLIKWDHNTDEVTKYSISEDGFTFQRDKNIFSGLSNCGDYLLLFPAFGDVILKFDKEAGHFSEYKEMPVPQDDKCEIFKYDKPKNTEAKVYAFARFEDTMYELDKTTGTITRHRLTIDEESYKPYMSDFWDTISGEVYADNEDCIISDNNIGSVTDIFSLTATSDNARTIRRRESSRKFSANPDGTAGGEVYGLLRGVSG